MAANFDCAVPLRNRSVCRTRYPRSVRRSWYIKVCIIGRNKKFLQKLSEDMVCLSTILRIEWCFQCNIFLLSQASG